jgi:transcriptional/translational regulatory protein YebC/TACO1
MIRADKNVAIIMLTVRDSEEDKVAALDAGADDFSSDDEVFEITTAPESFSGVRQELENNGIEFISAEISMIPNNTVDLNAENAEKVERLIERLDDDDDVQNVWNNAEFPEGWDERE